MAQTHRKRHTPWLDESEDETHSHSDHGMTYSSDDDSDHEPRFVKESNRRQRVLEKDDDIPTRIGLGKTSIESARPDKDFASFERYSKGIGSKLMQKMGYVMGQGLGKQGSGMAAPIDVKLRPQRAGLGNVEEKPERTLQHERAQKHKGKVKEKPEGWKKHPMDIATPSKRKYKSAQQVIDEQVLPTTAEPISTKIIDMTGKDVRVLNDINESTSSSLGEMSRSEGYLAELKHNTLLLADMALADLERVSRQRKMESFKLEKLKTQKSILEESRQKEELKLSRMKQVLAIVHELQQAAFQNTSAMMGAQPSQQDWFEAYEPYFQNFQLYIAEFHQLCLDQLLVAVITPHFKADMLNWNPLESPGWGLKHIQKFKSLFQSFSTPSDTPDKKDRPVMSPFDGMLYTYWLPRIRSCINNDWNPKHPDALISVMDHWQVSLVSSHASPLLPLWMSHNIAFQLLLPKLTQSVQDWRPSANSVQLIHLWLHPWLPVLGDALDPLWTEVRRKFESFFKDFNPADPLCFEVMVKWKDIFSKDDLKRLLRTTIIPSLEFHLRHRFEINPASQDLVPLVEHVFPWSSIVPSRHFSHLFESVFFPEWQNVLWVWIISPSANLEEITIWYKNWERVFEPLFNLASVKEGFREGLDKMNQALSLRSAGQTSYAPPPPSKKPNEKTPAVKTATGAIAEPTLSFKDYVEHVASEQNIPLLPLNRLHPGSGKPLYRLGALNMYMDKELIYLQKVPRGEYDYVSVEDALSIASTSSRPG